MAERDNAQLTAEVLAELRRDTFLEPLAIQVIADNGIVTLTGSIDSELNRQAIEDAARRVAGVRDVRNYLTLMGAESSSRSDDDVRAEVIEQLQRDPTIEAERFRVRVRFGRVFLTGTAESLEERESVVAAAQRVPGVEAIDDRTDVHVPVIDQEPGQA